VEISSPHTPVIQNVDALAHTDPAGIRENLGMQLYSPVQWVRSVQAMGAQGVTRIIEAGPGKVLAGLCKRIDKSIDAVAVHDTASLDSALSES
jgi:[acyl-carrier-protein] S-malonyltransferase